MSSAVISVIVPVYKVEPWLDACVESLLAQTFTDFELILVDDGSPDGCPALCDAWAAKDGRVRVIHRENGGLSAARNSGIAAAKGGYLAFVDSDDIVAPDYLGAMYAALTEHDADMALCGVEDVQEDGTSLSPQVLTVPDAPGCFEGRALLHAFYGENSPCYTVAWNKLYKASLWRELRYPEGMIHEDDAVAHELFWACDRVACLAQPLYFYRLRQGSICHTALTPARFDSVEALLRRVRFLDGHSAGPELLDKALTAAWLRYLSLCGELAAQQSTSAAVVERWQAVQRDMQTLLPRLGSCSGLSFLQKLSCRKWAKRAPRKLLGAKEGTL